MSDLNNMIGDVFASDENVIVGNVFNPDKVRGKSAYDGAIEAGYIGSEEQFYKTLAELNVIAPSESIIITPQMFGAVGDGVADDTVAIQAALDSSSLVYIPDGTYMIDAAFDGYGHESEGGIKPKSGQTIILSNNATLKAFPNSSQFYNIINLFNVNDVTICGGKVEGDKDTHTGEGGEWGHGIAIRACRNITIDGVECFNCWGDSAYIGKGGIDNCNNIRIYNCKLHDSRRQGISVTGVVDAVIRDCEVYNIKGAAPQSGIDIEPNETEDGVAKNILIDSCYIHDTESSAIIITKVTNAIEGVKVTNCHVTGGIQCLGGDGVVVDNSIVSGFQVSSKIINVSNCSIKNILLAGGNGIFSNCEFIADEDSDSVITVDTGGYPNKVTDFLEFSGCYFKTSTNNGYFMKMGGCSTLVDGVFPEKQIKFTSCKIEIRGSSIFLYRMPHELILDNCDVIHETPPYALFQLKNSWDTRLMLRDTTFTWGGTVSCIISFGAYDGYTVEIYSCKFAKTSRCLECNSSGATGGVVKMFNSIVSNIGVLHDNKLTTIFANGIDFEPTDNSHNLITSGAVKVVKDSIPTKISQLTNDVNFLTGFTESDPTVPSWAKQSSKPSYSKSEVGLGNVDNVKQYSESNPPPYPVTSVNGNAGDVTVFVPTKTSHLTNDSNFLTSHQDISGKADKSSAETWTFTLEDGSTVTKKVVLA